MLTGDIFCRVIDNFGDAGIAWRLARSLNREKGWRLRLIIDDLTTLSKIVPEIDPEKNQQCVDAIEVVRWTPKWDTLAPETIVVPNVVIEAFSCYLPEPYEAAIAQANHSRSIHVFALDYLTAEDYAENSHGCASPHPRYGYPKTFFFPGFTPKTGGLFYEKDLATNQATFLAHGGRDAFLRSIHADPTHPFSLFVFTYPSNPVEDLAKALAHDPRPTQLIVAPGQAGDTLEKALSALNPPHVTLVRSPMIPQRDFDTLLWSMDAAIVRGEDSVMRAQLAGTPMLWTLYPQEENTHLIKLEAFAKRYHEYLPSACQVAWDTLERELNQNAITPSSWMQWRDHLSLLKAGAQAWQRHLFSESSLTERLSDFVTNK